MKIKWSRWSEVLNLLACHSFTCYEIFGGIKQIYPVSEGYLRKIPVWRTVKCPSPLKRLGIFAPPLSQYFSQRILTNRIYLYRIIKEIVLAIKQMHGLVDHRQIVYHIASTFLSINIHCLWKCTSQCRFIAQELLYTHVYRKWLLLEWNVQYFRFIL